MRDSYSDLSMQAGVHDDRTHIPAESAVVAKLQQALGLANQNCDRATALAQKLANLLRGTLIRVHELESGLDDRLQAELQNAVSKLQAEADVRVGRTQREANERISRMKTETENRIACLQRELAKVKQRAEEAKVEADAHVELIRGEARERVVRANAEAGERFSRMQCEVESQLRRFASEYAQANSRAESAEQWLLLIRQEIEKHLIPSLVTMHETFMTAKTELDAQGAALAIRQTSDK